MKTTATRVPGGWRINGTKVFISHAAHAACSSWWPRSTSQEAQGRHGAARRPRASRGSRSGVPDAYSSSATTWRGALQGRLRSGENLLGEPGGGFPVLGSALDMGRYSVAARSIGQAQRCIDLSIAYAREREAFGQKIGEFQMIQQKIADMICRTEGARGVVYRLGRMKDAGVERASMEASLAKLMASEAATQNALDAIQIHGGYGVTAEYEIGRLLLEAKVLEIGEGTSELHRKLIAEHVLGLRSQ
jgi:alkylation response protein AidB-like acyl-CoA dehydrogenase